VQGIKGFWREYEKNPVGLEAAVEQAWNTLTIEGWQCLSAAIEGLLLRKAMQQMLGRATTPLDLDVHLDALKLASMAHSAPTDQLMRRRSTPSRSSDVPAGTAWSEGEIECLMRLSVQGLTRDTVPPTCKAAMRALILCKLGLAMALARQKRASMKTTPRTAGAPARTVSTERVRSSV